MITKSSIMLGLGESDDELKEAMADLRAIGVDILTLGQYLQVSYAKDLSTILLGLDKLITLPFLLSIVGGVIHFFYSSCTLLLSWLTP